MSIQRRGSALLSAILIFASGGCSGGSSTDESGPISMGGGSSGAAIGCYAGEFEACTCDTGDPGLRACLEDGARGECDCGLLGPEGPGVFVGSDDAAPGLIIIKRPIFDIVADPVDDVLYATFSAPSAENEDSLVAIAPTTGETLWAVEAGDQPSFIGVSDDASTAYVGLRGTPGIARIDLASQSKTADYEPPVPLRPYVLDIEVVPGAPDRALLVPSDYPAQPGYGELVFIENGVVVGAPPPFVALDDVVFRDAATAYGYDSSSTAATLATLDVTASGYTITQQTDNVFQDFTRHLQFDGEWLLTDGSQAVDPESNTVVGTYPERGALAVDVATGRTYVAHRVGDTYAIAISICDRDTFTETASVSLEPVSGEPRKSVVTRGGTLAVLLEIGDLADESDDWLVLVHPSRLENP